MNFLEVLATRSYFLSVMSSLDHCWLTPAQLNLLLPRKWENLHRAREPHSWMHQFLEVGCVSQVTMCELTADKQVKEFDFMRIYYCEPWKSTGSLAQWMFHTEFSIKNLPVWRGAGYLFSCKWAWADSVEYSC